MRSRFHHILVPLDLTAGNDAAIDIAFELAVQNKAVISLLHVIQQIEGEAEPQDAETNAFYEQLRQRAASDLERVAQRFSDAEIECELKIHIGDRLRDIVEFSGRHRVDLIVMSSHPIDRERLAETWATLSYKVSVMCACPILLVK